MKRFYDMFGQEITDKMSIFVADSKESRCGSCHEVFLHNGELCLRTFDYFSTENNYYPLETLDLRYARIVYNHRTNERIVYDNWD